MTNCFCQIFFQEPKYQGEKKLKLIKMIKVCGGVPLIRWWYLINVTTVCAKQCVCIFFTSFCICERVSVWMCVCWVNYSQLPPSREPVCTEQPYLCTTYLRLITHTHTKSDPSLIVMTNNTNMAWYALQLTDWNTACYCNPLMYSFSLV